MLKVSFSKQISWVALTAGLMSATVAFGGQQGMGGMQ